MNDVRSGVVALADEREVAEVVFAADLRSPKGCEILRALRFGEAVASELNLEYVFSEASERVSARGVRSDGLVTCRARHQCDREQNE